MSNFELGKPGYYVAQNVQKNEFLNRQLESDQYGIYYSVKFEGDAETYLWQTKTPPVEGEKYYGHIEESKSGKSLRFKKDKVEEVKPQQTGSTQSTDESIARAVALKAAVELFADTKDSVNDVLETANTFLGWLKNETIDLDKSIAEVADEDFDPNEIPPEFR